MPVVMRVGQRDPQKFPGVGTGKAAREGKAFISVREGKLLLLFIVT